MKSSMSAAAWVCVIGLAATVTAQPPASPRDPTAGQPAAADEPALLKVPDALDGENPTRRLVAQEVPEAGKPFRDGCFGTRLTRVTRQPGIRHEYARYDPFNKDGSLVVLVEFSQYDIRVYRTDSIPYDAKANLVCKLDLEQPRWDPSSADVIWGFREFQIRTVNVRTGKTTVVKDFSKDPTVGPLLKAEPDLYRITTKNQGESSMDMRYWALLLQGSKYDYALRHIVTWDRRKDRVLGVCQIREEERNVDCVGMSPLGNWVWIGGDWNNGGRMAGLTMANKELTQFHHLDYATGHSDVGLDADGREVVVMQNCRTDYIDMIPLDPKTKPVTEMEHYKSSNRTPLVRLFYADDSPLGCHCGVHVCCNMPGWCVISPHLEPDVKEQNWLDRSIILVRLKQGKPEAYYLAKIHNTTGAYWEETHAVMSNDGSKVLWASNWGQNVGQDRPFLIQLDMPRNWHTADRRGR